MSSVPENNIVETTDESGTGLEWTTHPMKKRPWVTVLVTVFILVIGAMVFSTTESKGFAVLALVVLFMSLAKFYLPTKYKLTEKYIIVKTTTQTIKKEWSMFRSFYPDKNGLLLSPFVRPTRMENFRGMYLIFNENKDQVIAFAKDHINDVIEDIDLDDEEQS